MDRSLACALLLASTFVSSLAHAQTTVIIQSPPPPPVIVVIEPPPPAQIVIVEAPPPPPPEPPPAPAPAPAGTAPRWLVDLSGDVLMGAGYDWPALGGSIRGGAMFDGGYTAQLALRYASSFDEGSEVTLGVEVQRDFSPNDPAGFLLLARVGTAFLLDDHGPFDSGIRLDGQVGIGGRFDLSSDLAILVDARGVVRYRPDDPIGPAQSDVSGGFLMTVGLRVRL